ncbi:MAG: hypothetical protein AABZ74_14210 [Cyanobacteriota bacterium]
MTETFKVYSLSGKNYSIKIELFRESIPTIKNDSSKNISKEFIGIICYLLKNLGVISDYNLEHIFKIHMKNRQSEFIKLLDNELCRLAEISIEKKGKKFIKKTGAKYILQIEKNLFLDSWIGNYYLYYIGTDTKYEILKLPFRIIRQCNNFFAEVSSQTTLYKGLIEEKFGSLFLSLDGDDESRIFGIIYASIGSNFNSSVGVCCFLNERIPTSSKIIIIKENNTIWENMKAQIKSNIEHFGFDPSFKIDIQKILFREFTIDSKTIKKPEVIICDKKFFSSNTENYIINL